MTEVVGWKISSSYWLEESRCVVLVRAFDSGILCGCNYIGVEIPLEECRFPFGGAEFCSQACEDWGCLTSGGATKRAV